MVDLNATQLGLEFGSGAVIGAIIGFAAKKIAKLIAVLVGLELALFKFLESKGYISVKWDELSGGILGAAQDTGQINQSWIEPLLSTLSISAGFGGGFLLGFRRG